MLQHERASAGAEAPSDDELLGAGDRVAQLLEEIRTIAGPSAWQRVEELVQRLLELYGAGLERVLRHASAVEGEEGALAARLRADELVSSLLLLHGLHPSSTEERVERALEDVRARLGAHELELLGVEADGTVRLRATADPRSCPSSAPTVVRAIERTILEAAPEVTRVEVEGLDAPAPAAREPLVQLRTPRDGEGR
jgi:Fe-S cluster biogenesis protein NfuA